MLITPKTRFLGYGVNKKDLHDVVGEGWRVVVTEFDIALQRKNVASEVEFTLFLFFSFWFEDLNKLEW